MNISKALLIAVVLSSTTVIQSMPMKMKGKAGWASADETNTANIIAFLRGLFNPAGRIFNSPSELDQPVVVNGLDEYPVDLIHQVIMPFIPFTTNPAWLRVIEVAQEQFATDANIIDEIIDTEILDTLPAETLLAIQLAPGIPADLRALAGIRYIAKNKKRIFAQLQMPSKRHHHDDGHNGGAGAGIFGPLSAF